MLIICRSESKHAVAERLVSLEPIIKKICSVAGAPGISLAVSYQGEVVHRANYGYRDVEASLPTNSDTMYPIGTLAKTFTASAIGILVDEGKLKWTTPIREILPEFQSSDPTVNENLTVVDLLCHRGGLARSNLWWQGAEGVLFLDKSETISFYNKLAPVGSFRADWAYSNWGYAVVGEVIEKLSGMWYGEYLSKKIFEPLGLNHTTTRSLDSATAENVAKPYAALDDTSPYLLPQPPVHEGTIMAPAMGGSSSADDLLRYSMALLEAQHFETNGSKTSPAPVLKNALTHLSGHIFTAKSMLEKSYAFGFYRSQLPSTVLGMGWNSIYVKKMPKLVPRGHCGPVIAHGGSLPGYHTAMALLPDLGSSVVVCTNSIALGDVSGWVSLAIIEALIDTPRPSDFASLATEAAQANANNVSVLVERLEVARTTANSSPRPLGEYIGRYYDRAHNWAIEIRKNKSGDGLEVAFQGLNSQVWALKHYENDTFLWLASREEQAKRGRMTTYPLVANHFKLIFQNGADGAINSVCWPHEAGVPMAEQCFMRVK